MDINKEFNSLETLSKLTNRLKKLNIHLKFVGNFPWIYLDSVNDVKVVEKTSDSNHGFNICFLPIRPHDKVKLVNLKEMFSLIRKYINSEIKQDYITYKQAKKLFNKNFTIPTIYPYINGKIDFDRTDLIDGSVLYIDYNYRYEGQSMDIRGETFSAPEQSQVVEWLKTKHGIWVYLECDVYGDGWYPKILPCSRVVWSNVELREKIEEFTRHRNLWYKTTQEAYSVAFDYVLKELI